MPGLTVVAGVTMDCAVMTMERAVVGRKICLLILTVPLTPDTPKAADMLLYVCAGCRSWRLLDGRQLRSMIVRNAVTVARCKNVRCSLRCHKQASPPL